MNPGQFPSPASWPSRRIPSAVRVAERTACSLCLTRTVWPLGVCCPFCNMDCGDPGREDWTRFHRAAERWYRCRASQPPHTMVLPVAGNSPCSIPRSSCFGFIPVCCVVCCRVPVARDLMYARIVLAEPTSASRCRSPAALPISPDRRFLPRSRAAAAGPAPLADLGIPDSDDL